MSQDCLLSGMAKGCRTNSGKIICDHPTGHACKTSTGDNIIISKRFLKDGIFDPLNHINNLLKKFTTPKFTSAGFFGEIANKDAIEAAQRDAISASRIISEMVAPTTTLHRLTHHGGARRYKTKKQKTRRRVR